MDESSSQGGPSILQLQKWDPSLFHLNLAEFREAFISPTRELLVLLSYQSEGLFLPLTGGAVDGNIADVYSDDTRRSSSSSASCSAMSAAPSRLGRKTNDVSPLGSERDLNNEFLPPFKDSSFPIIADVKSLAWGTCGDSYNQHKEALYKEFLFVCGSNGVTVHAFCCLDDSDEITGSILEGEHTSGRWVKWGPCKSEVDCESLGNVDDQNTAQKTEFIQKIYKKDGEASSGLDASNRLMRSFFTKVKTIESEGSTWTNFPEKSSYPRSARVVSFSLFDSDIPLLNLLSRGNSLVNKISQETMDINLLANAALTSSSGNFDSDVLTENLSARVSNSYQCTKVFSSSSHLFVGFFLKFLDAAAVTTTEDNQRNKSNDIIIFTQLYSWGLHWVSAVKLEESLDTAPAEWTDFQISDNLVICLDISGVVFFYDTLSGEYVATLNFLKLGGRNRSSNMHGRKIDKQIELGNEVHSADHSVKRKFRKLIVASHTSLLAAVDQYGAIYVVNYGDHVPKKYFAADKFLPHLQHLGLGKLVGWEVGGVDIGHQRMNPNLSGFENTNIIPKRYESNNSGNVGFMVHKFPVHGLSRKNGQITAYSSGFSSHSNAAQKLQECEADSHFMREVFLPIDRFGEDNCICFSPLGITRLSRRFMNTEQRRDQIVHLNMHIVSSVNDDRHLNSSCELAFIQGIEKAFVEEAVGCHSHGYLYLVTKSGLSVFLPSVSVSSNLLPVETIGYQQPTVHRVKECQERNNLEIKDTKDICSPQNAEILDRILLFDGPKKADLVCLENGWDLKLSRIRRLQMALDYLKFDDIDQSLEMLGHVKLAEEGVLRLVFAAVYILVHKNGNDNDVSAASRLLALATGFATKMIRKYGMLEYKIDRRDLQGLSESQMFSFPLALRNKDVMDNSRKLREMAHFLEIIRNLQSRLGAKLKPSGQLDDTKVLSLVEPNVLSDESQLAIVPANAVSMETSNPHKASPGLDDEEKLALVVGDSSEVSALVLQGKVYGQKVLPLENPKEMIARWKVDKLDLRTVVKDALLSGRLPLAVLQLHLHHSKETVADKESQDTFTEVRDIGRAIAYELFLKGQTGLAIATLQRLGEDVETCLKQLLFGTVRKSLRAQIAEEMRNYGYLGPYEWDILERISLVERLYPSNYFWKTYIARQENSMQGASASNSAAEINLHLIDSCMFSNLFINCGEIDGVVLGSWTNINENASDPVIDEDGAHAGYWAAAAVWCSTWDDKTVDRIVLDQPLLMGVHVPWESQLEYHMCHNDWDEVSKLLDIVPTSGLLDGSIQIALDGSNHGSTVGNSELTDYICSIQELDAVCIHIPGIKIFRLSAEISCSIWLKMLIERDLTKKLIFLKKYWGDTADIVHLLSQAGFITSGYKVRVDGDADEDLDSSDRDGKFHVDTVHALHKLFLHYCVQHSLPSLLDLYLDHHKLVLDEQLLCSLEESAGDCHWAKWLLLSRIKGREYDASFSNARSIVSSNSVPIGNLNVPDVDERIYTVDDIAEAGGNMAAIATLMYAPAPIQKCISSGSIRHSSTSAQCTLENLRPILQRLPTLWRELVEPCFEQDVSGNFSVPGARNALSEYLNWRDKIFFSSGRDTSLLQMLPYWFPKAVRRLVQLYIQGPLGWLSFSGLPTGETLLHRDVDFIINADERTEISAISWEAIVQKHIEDELYDSSMKETGPGLEHYLHRGRALAAFNHLLGLRVAKLKAEKPSSSLAHGQTNVRSDAQKLLAPITQSEESLLSSVMPLAITHYEESVLVASCAFLLELCGLSASMLRVDVAVLKRIASFYKSEKSDTFKQVLHRSSMLSAISNEGDIMGSLARAVAEEYIHQDIATSSIQKDAVATVTPRQTCRALRLVLHHLEKASLPQMVDGKTCGYWLSTGNGDGADLRSRQKIASQNWNLVAVFCQMHQLPLSTKYLALLARDNDWVGFLSEAQFGGYPFDIVVQVASKEFSDQRLKNHILTVLRGIQIKKKASSSSHLESAENNESPFLDENVYLPVELFQILADCERQKNPGKALLIKAKELSWSILAMIASCFPDVSPLPCLAVWLEITAARETSSIKVNDIASQVAESVAAAVEATNSLPSDSRAVLFHFNRKNPKRRRLLEPFSVESLLSTTHASSTSDNILFAAQDIVSAEGGRSEPVNATNDLSERPAALLKMVAVLCEQHLFSPLLRAFELFLPSCSLLPFIRALQAFSQMRLSEARAHLGSFSARIKEPVHSQAHSGRESHIETSWISSTAVKAAEAVLSTCPSPYEKRCLLQLLAETDFGDGGYAATYYRRLHWKINLAEPSLRKNGDLHLGNETLDDGTLLTALENNSHWEQARNWAKQLEAIGAPWRSAFHHVTETQAESMVAEWKEFLWDVPEERIALWSHCQTLFKRHSFPDVQAGLFFLKHAEAVEKDLPARELHQLLLLSLQWLSGMITQSNPVYPLQLLREIETKAWLLAVESEAQKNSEGELSSANFAKGFEAGDTVNIIDQTASMITKMDNHINAMKNRMIEKHDTRDNSQAHFRNQVPDTSPKTKRRAKAYMPSRRPLMDSVDKSTTSEDSSNPNFRSDLQLQDESTPIDVSFSKWEERIGPEELERAVLSLLEFGQITAAKQLQHKLSPGGIPSEFKIVDTALKLAAISTPSNKVPISMLDDEVCSVIQLCNMPTDQHLLVCPLQVLENLATVLVEGTGRALCKRIIAVVKAANVLDVPFSEAYEKQPVELFRLLSLKAQESFEEANLLVQTHSMAAASIAQILAESFLKGLLAAHRGGYMDSQKEEGPAPLLWRFSDFLKWAELCPSESEVGHALMRLVITRQEIPHACEVELLILSDHFYKSSACLDGVDVLVALAATRVEEYVLEGDFACLARLITGVGNFHALNFILGILIENCQLDLLLQKYSAAADTNTGTAAAVRGFRMAVLTSLKHFNPNDLDAFALVYNHFDMKHDTATLLELRAKLAAEQWFRRCDTDQNEDLLDSMRYYIQAAEVHSSIDAGNKARKACAQASLVSLKIRIPDNKWLNLSETKARRVLVEQSRFQEALIVAEAYSLNQPSEWVPVLWNQMFVPELMEEFVAEFVAVLPLQPSMLTELARFYRAEVAARGDQSQFSVWLTGGILPAESLGRSFRCLLKRTRDLKLRFQVATLATGFTDVVNICNKVLDKVPENSGPLVLRKGHGGAYLPLM